MIGFIWALIQLVFAVAALAGIIVLLAGGWASVSDWPPTAGQAQGGLALLAAVAVSLFLGKLWAGPKE